MNYTNKKLPINDSPRGMMSLLPEINALKNDPEAIEELLRSRFGYVKDGETFVRLLPKGDLPSE
jgi:hypothetical protein